MSYVYIWPESVASKGSQEIGSCILQHLRSNLSPEAQRLILYCDPYFGQNRNIKLSLMIQKFLDSWSNEQLNSIQQRFFVNGHAFNSCDRCFEMIKNRKKNVFTSSQLIDIMNNPRRKIYAMEMHTENFLSTKPLENLLVSKKVAADERKINWHSYESITYNRGKPFVLSVKQFDNTVADVHLKKRIAADQLSNIDLPQLYPKGRYISKFKFDDLKEFLISIPNQYHTFYDSLKYLDSKEEKDFAFCVRESSDEEDS